MAWKSADFLFNSRNFRVMKKLSLSVVILLFFPTLLFAQLQRPYKLSELNQNGIPRLLDGITTVQQWGEKKEEIRRSWLAFLGALPDRPAVQYKIEAETTLKDHIRQKIVFNTIYDDSVTAFLLIPQSVKSKKTKAPAILALQPTNEQGKTSVATPFKENNVNRYYGYELVSRGYVVLAPDDLTSGERVYPGQKAFYSAPFYKKYPHWNIIAKTLVDHMQGVDLLSGLGYVDADRIGAIGVSFGGYNSFFLSSVDSRIKAVVPICGLSPFTGDANPQRWGIRDWYTHFPKMNDYLSKDEVPFEMNEIIALSAPTPMFFYVAQNDHIFPHWQRIAETLNDVYSLYDWLGYSNRFQYSIGPGDHDFPVEIRKWAYDFLDQNLKPGK